MSSRSQKKEPCHCHSSRHDGPIPSAKSQYCSTLGLFNTVVARDWERFFFDKSWFHVPSFSVLSGIWNKSKDSWNGIYWWWSMIHFMRDDKSFFAHFILLWSTLWFVFHGSLYAKRHGGCVILALFLVSQIFFGGRIKLSLKLSL